MARQSTGEFEKLFWRWKRCWIRRA